MSNPQNRWDGFKPVGYWLDPTKVLALPLIEMTDAGEVETTVGDIFQKLKDKQLTEESLGSFGVYAKLETTDGSRLNLKGSSFNRHILETLLTYRAGGLNLFSAVFYYYDEDYCLEDPQQCFTFFVVHDGKIIRERQSFFDHCDSGFDPSVLETDSDPTWAHEGEWAEAQAKFWYRKFYSETRTGQLMTLRTDNPTLFFNKDRTALDIIGSLGAITRSLNTVRLLLWALLILAAIGFFLRWVR